MNYLLTTHERAYSLSFNDGLLSIFSGSPYARRHWELANRFPEHALGHRVIAVLQAIPVVGLLFCLIEKVAAFFLSRPAPALGAPRPVSVTPIKKVSLQSASQYDGPPGAERPGACTFHAVCALKELSTRFDQVFNWISENNSLELTTFQMDVILNKGLDLYARACQRNREYQQGADFTHILPYLPSGIRLVQPANHDQLQPFQTRLNQVIDHLFASTPQTKTVWIKNGNEESFAVVSRGQRTIIFDSHKNEIIGTTTREAARAALEEKLLPFSHEVEGVDATPFDFALTHN